MFSVVTMLVVAGCAFVILVTAGKADAAQEAVLGQIDAQGTRTIVVRAKGDQPGLTTQAVDQLARTTSVESVLGLGPVTDATAAAVPDGTRVGVRTAYGSVGVRPLPVEPAAGRSPVVLMSPAASRTVGLPEGRGSLRLVDGPDLLVAGSVEVPAYLAPLEPLVLRPVDDTVRREPVPLTTIVVLARSSRDVDAVTAAVRGLLVDVPPDGATVETSSAMAELREAVSGELTRQGRSIVVGLLGAATAATLLNVCGLVLLRRKDFGRRRALGASRLMIVVLVVTSVLVVSVVGALLGSAAGVAWLVRSGHPPTPTYVVSVAAALVASAVVAGALPAWLAARRDPLRELRVP